jgi:DNA-binding transcriptional LysR family regulator
MKIEYISTFLEIAECGNFNRAADNLNVTQSTVSARVKSMEDRFGRILFKRGHAGVELTSAGQHFLQYAHNIQRQWQQAKQRIALPESFNHTIGLGSQVSLWDSLILQWMPWMRQNASEIALHVEADYSPSLMRQVSDGLLDIGVMYQPRQTSGLIIEDLFEETLILVTTDKQAVEKGWIEHYVFVDWGDAFRARHSAAFPDLETPAISVGLGALGLEYILQNGGAGYFPVRVVKSLLENKKLFTVNNTPSLQRPAYMVYASAARDPSSLKVALQGLREVAKVPML